VPALEFSSVFDRLEDPTPPFSCDPSIPRAAADVSLVRALFCGIVFFFFGVFFFADVFTLFYNECETVSLPIPVGAGFLIHGDKKVFSSFNLK